jgi:hypothetical protein
LDVSSASTQPFRVGVGATNAIVVDNNGRVGIGITNPAVALDVTGNVRCSGGYNLNYSSVPTYASNQIGYTVTTTAGSGTNNIPFGIGSKFTQFANDIILTPGVWLIFIEHTVIAASTSPIGISLWLDDLTTGSNANLKSSFFLYTVNSYQTVSLTHVLSTNVNKTINYNVTNNSSSQTASTLNGTLNAIRIG